MKRALKFVATLSTMSAIAIVPLTISAGAASAQPKGLEGSYIGAGISPGLTNGGQNGDAATFGGNIQGRVDLGKAPVSLRGAILFSDETSAIMPIVSYDVPIAESTNLYAGAGYSFVEADGKPTPLGNRDAAVLTVGIEREVVDRLVLYSDTKLGISAYKDSPASALSVQFGAAYRF